MRQRLRSLSQDETVGLALIVAGVIFLVVKVAPWAVLAKLLKLWPLVLVAAGAVLVLRNRRSSPPPR